MIEEHWVIAKNIDGTLHDFVRCHPSRSQAEYEAFTADGFDTSVETVEVKNLVEAEALARVRIKELGK